MIATKDIDVRVPDIGDFDDVDIIDILVKPGDIVGPEDPLITLESEKATMDIPSPGSGEINEIRVAVGDQVSEGALILTMRPPSSTTEEETTGAPEVEIASAKTQPATPESASAEKTAQSYFAVRVPDIGDFEDVEVIEILVAPGDGVSLEDPLITLESDKATMDIPAPCAGTIGEIAVNVGDKISEGALIVSLSTVADTSTPLVNEPAASPTVPPSVPKAKPGPADPQASATALPVTKAHASPSVRKFARELGVDVSLVKGSGDKGRVLQPDVQLYVKEVMGGARGHSTGNRFELPAAPEIDFTKFGEIEVTPLSKIRKLTGRNLHRSWVTVPHVFQMDEANITELEAFRKSKLEEAERKGTKLTLLAFLVKAVVVALHKFPDFNASLSPDGESLIHKKYFHIGMAVNTENGLIVPVIRDVDTKGLYELAHEVRELSHKARNRKITPAEMQGACFTISSLGGVGGTAFTPIINTPEVGILGISPSVMKPVYRNGEFVARLMLPFTLSYDHRVIDGVAAAQFTRYLTTVLGDIRHILL